MKKTLFLIISSLLLLAFFIFLRFNSNQSNALTFTSTTTFPAQTFTALIPLENQTLQTQILQLAPSLFNIKIQSQTPEQLILEFLYNAPDYTTCEGYLGDCQPEEFTLVPFTQTINENDVISIAENFLSSIDLLSNLSLSRTELTDQMYALYYVYTANGLPIDYQQQNFFPVIINISDTGNLVSCTFNFDFPSFTYNNSKNEILLSSEQLVSSLNQTKIASLPSTFNSQLTPETKFAQIEKVQTSIVYKDNNFIPTYTIYGSLLDKKRQFITVFSFSKTAVY